MKKHIILTVVLATLLANATQGQEQLAASMRQTRAEATSSAGQLHATLQALNGLVSRQEGDLRPAYQAFKAEIPKTQWAANATKLRAESMARERDRYFADWQSTINGINNLSLQKKAQKRLQKAAEGYDKTRAALVAASDRFRPFLSDLADVEKALSNDVTASGVKSIKGVTRQANWNYQSVSKAIEKALREMEKMERALSSQAT